MDSLALSDLALFGHLCAGGVCRWGVLDSEVVMESEEESEEDNQRFLTFFDFFLLFLVNGVFSRALV